jgi:deoxyhypusine synthase
MSEPVESAARKLGLRPMHPYDVNDAGSVSDLIRGLSNTAFTGRQLGEAADVMEEMLGAGDCKVVVTLSGAMTMAGFNLLIREMIERDWVHCLVSTGALVGHGMVETLGMKHYKARPDTPDEQYFKHGLNRVYDTIEPEGNLDALEATVRELFSELARQREGEPVGTMELLAFLGQRLPGRGILQAAAHRDVPVFIPAFTDSELALDLAVHHAISAREGEPAVQYDAFRDLEAFRVYCETVAERGEHLGIFTIGGGVPRNWAQQVGPFSDVRNVRLGKKQRERLKFKYGIRICPDPPHYGHLSGCTYSEGVSWGKFIPESEGGRFAEVLSDATIAWPLLVQAMIERGL